MRSAYLASRFSRGPELREYAAQLATTSITCTSLSGWLGEGPQSEELDDEAGLKALRDLHDIERADALIAFTEPPRSTTSRGGRHVETGIALGLGKRVLIVGLRENVFHAMPQIEGPFATFADLFEVLRYEKMASKIISSSVRPARRNGHGRSDRT
jgi:hypothetical protein